MTARVFFAIRARNIDVSSVEEHGVVTYLLARPPSPFKTDECVEAIEGAMDRNEYHPGEDLIAIAGPSILTALLVAVASSRGSVRVLLWDAPGERYIERSFELAQRRTA